MNHSKEMNMSIQRRTLLKSSPVIATIMASPVSATNVGGCMVASSFVSVATFASRNPGSSPMCTNQTVEYWQEQIRNGVEVKGTVKKLLAGPGGTYGDRKVKDVLSMSVQTSGELGVLQHLCSLILSFQAGKVAVGSVNITYLQTVWKSYQTNQPNYISPSGLQMTEEQLIGWLRALMGYAIL